MESIIILMYSSMLDRVELVLEGSEAESLLFLIQRGRLATFMIHCFAFSWDMMFLYSSPSSLLNRTAIHQDRNFFDVMGKVCPLFYRQQVRYWTVFFRVFAAS